MKKENKSMGPCFSISLHVLFIHLTFILQTLDSSRGEIWCEKMVQYRSNAEREDREAVQREMA